MLKFSAAIACLLAFSNGVATQGKEIQLSPTGPISTPQAARDAARKAGAPVVITVAEGTYSMTEALALSKEDSGVTWRAAKGAHPTFSGGKVISGWQKAEGGAWKAAVPEVKEGKWYFEQLWVNGHRATRARTPNKGFFNITDGVGPGVFPGLDKDMNFRAFAVAPEHYRILKAIPAEERDGVLVTVTHAWAVGQCRIKALNDEAQAVEIKGRSRYPFVEFEPDQRYWLENFRGALDAPGEWFLDKAKGEVLYIPLPGEDMNKVEAIAPVADKFVVIKGAENIAFNGLRFTAGNYAYPAEGLHDTQAATTTDGSIEIEDSRHISFEDCEVSHTGRHAIVFKSGCHDSSVTHSHLFDLGGGGVYVGEVARPAEDRVNSGISVTDCIIQHGGRLHPSACGVAFTHTQKCTVAHCDIGDFYYTGVSAGWNWGYGDTASRETSVLNNHIHHLGWAYLSDMGGFYGLGSSPGTVVSGNHVHHISSHRYGGWGLYTDEGSTDVRMENNLVHDTWNSGFHQHYGYYNKVSNNIFAFGHTAQIQRSRNEGRLCFVYEHNIVVWEPEIPLLDGGEYNWKLNDKAERGEPRDSAIFRNNLYWPTDGKVPGLLTKTHFTWKEWQGMGRDKGSLFADPMFEDLAKRDFRLKKGSPAEKIGFKPWDLTEAGVSKADKEWRALAEKGNDYSTWNAEAKPWPAPVYKVEMQTFEGVPVGSIGIRNASYKHQDKGESIGVTDEVSSPIPLPDGSASSKRCLKFQDVPGLLHGFDPVLDIHPNWTEGTYRVSFDAMSQPGAEWFFEMRVNGGEFAAGPYIRYQKGRLVAGNTASVTLADIAPGEWFRITITAATGTGKYKVTVSRPNQKEDVSVEVPCKTTWNAASYLLFSAVSDVKTAFFIDNVSLVKVE